MAIRIYELEKAGPVKQILEAPDTKDEQGNWIKNEFKTQGYKLQDAKSLGIEKEASYLYISASEDFFEKNEQKLLDAGAKKLEGEEFETVRQKIESAEEEAVGGMGAIFGE